MIQFVTVVAGHTSWSTAGLGYLTFWLLGKLRCFDGTPHPLRFVAAILPLLGAVWIGRGPTYWGLAWFPCRQCEGSGQLVAGSRRAACFGGVGRCLSFLLLAGLYVLAPLRSGAC